LLQDAIVPTYKKIILNQQGWHRIAQIKFDSANKANGSIGNNCEIEINRPYMNGRNEFHKIQLVSLINSSKFQNERSNGVDAFYITKIRHVVDTNTNTCYLEIYYNSSSENQPIVTLSNHMNFDGMFWELIEPELTSETVDGVTVLGNHNFSLTYDIKAEVDSKVSNRIYTSWSPVGQFETSFLQSGNSTELGFAPNRVFLLTLFNEYNQSCIAILETGSSVTTCKVTVLKGSAEFFQITPVSRTNISIIAKGANCRITYMCLGGVDF
jgi:hypothetical protein